MLISDTMRKSIYCITTDRPCPAHGPGHSGGRSLQAIRVQRNGAIPRDKGYGKQGVKFADYDNNLQHATVTKELKQMPSIEVSPSATLISSIFGAMKMSTCYSIPAGCDGCGRRRWSTRRPRCVRGCLAGARHVLIVGGDACFVALGKMKSNNPVTTFLGDQFST